MRERTALSSFENGFGSGGETMHPYGDYLVALNKLSKDQYLPVGPDLPESQELIDISGEKMRMLSGFPTPPEPHDAVFIAASVLKGKVKQVFDLADNAVKPGEESVVRTGPNAVTVNMTMIRSAYTPETIEVLQEHAKNSAPLRFERRRNALLALAAAQAIDLDVVRSIRDGDVEARRLAVVTLTGAALQVQRRCRLLQPEAHLANLARKLRSPWRAIRCLRHDLHGVLAGLRRAEHRPRLAQRLSLPQLRQPLRKVTRQRIERHRQCPAPPGRPQPCIHLIQPPIRPKMACHANQPLAELAEEMAVDRAAAAVAMSAGRLAAGLVEENEVEVAVIIGLATAKFAKRQDNRLARVALPVGVAIPELAGDIAGKLLVAGPANRGRAELTD